MTDLADAPSAIAIQERTVYNKVEDFVAHVIYDGRYLDSFTLEPDTVADHLGVILAPEVEQSLRGRDRSLVLAEITDRMTQTYGRVRDGREIFASHGVAIVIGVVVPIVCLFLEVPLPVDDPDGDSKL